MATFTKKILNGKFHFLCMWSPVKHLWWSFSGRMTFSRYLFLQNSSHGAKSVRIRSYSGPHFSRIFPHSDRIRRDSISPYSVLMRKNPGKTRTRITPNTDSFYAVVNGVNNCCIVLCVFHSNSFNLYFFHHFVETKTN